MSWEIPSGAVFNNTTQGADFLFRTKLNQTYSGYGLISDISRKRKTEQWKIRVVKTCFINSLFFNNWVDLAELYLVIYLKLKKSIYYIFYIVLLYCILYNYIAYRVLLISNWWNLFQHNCKFITRPWCLLQTTILARGDVDQQWPHDDEM